MEPRIQYCTTEDGVSIAYFAIGTGTPLVCHPPLLWSHLQLEWQNPPTRAWYEQLAKTRTLVRYDPRGQGLSERNVRDFSLETYVRDQEAGVDRLELKRFALYSSGPNTPLAIAYAARHPVRVTHLILWHPQTTARAPGAPGPALEDVAEKDWEIYTEALAHASLGWSQDELAREWAYFIRQSINQETWLELLGHLDEVDVTSVLPEVSSPTLVLARPQNRQVDASQVSALASRIQNARLVFLGGTEPAPQFGDIDEGLRTVDEFLGEGEEVAARVSAPGGFATILFTDMESSTALRQRLGDAQAQELVRAHNKIVRAALSANAGSEIKHTGDGIMASFPTATAALRCGIDIQRGVAAHKDEHQDSPLAVYVGLNAGEPIAEEDDLFGTSVDLARRICDHAEPGQILASNVVRELAEGKGFLFGDIGDVVPKGFEEPVRLYEVRWEEQG